jgi:hypothetical protein
MILILYKRETDSKIAIETMTAVGCPPSNYKAIMGVSSKVDMLEAS